MRHGIASTFLLGLAAFSFTVFGGCETAKKLNTSNIPHNAFTPSSSPSTFLKRSEARLCEADYGTDYSSLAPDTAIDYRSVQYQNITLEQCIQSALQNSEVFRELGGAIVNQSSTIRTAMDPALQFTNPLTGEEAALSAFDANIASSLFFEDIHRPFNNRFSGDQGLLRQELLTSQFEISKLAATGTQFTSRASVNYDANNQTGNRFGSAWEAVIDNGFRHPLFQGSGSLFNRIAGPSRIPGNYNGILIARTNTEMSLADFEDSVREFVSNVENAYWDLHYAYRELEAQTAARDAAAQVAQKAQRGQIDGRIGGLEVASSKEQLLRFESAIIESMEGRLIDGTQVNSGISGGSFRRSVGVRTAERRLRYLVGMPITDGTLLKPVDQPLKAPLAFDWYQSVHSALARRPEIRRQKWMIKQKELELTAARNFLLPRVDLVGNYRLRGLGKHLAGSGATLNEDIVNNRTSQEAKSDSISDLFSGEFQEVSLGAELALPIGFRQANSGVRNAELSVQREKAVLKEQERKIVLDLSNTIAECRRAYNAMKAAEQRHSAAVEYRCQAEDRLVKGQVQYDVPLEAQRRILEAQLQYINAEVEYVIAIKNVHFEKATFLNYHGIGLAESQSNSKADSDYRTRRSRLKKPMNYVMQDPPIGATLGSASQIGTSQTHSMNAPAASRNVPAAVVGNQQVFPKTVSASGAVSTKLTDAIKEPVSTPVSARGLGKKHVYEPKFLPPPSKVLQ